MAEITGEENSRRTHERQVVEALRRAGADDVAQPDLIRKTGLARGTVVSIVRRLEEKRLVDTHLENRSGPEGGRPAKVVSIRADAGYSLGIHFGHRHVRVSAGHLQGYQIFYAERSVGSESEAQIDVGANAQASLDRAVELAQAAIAQNREEGRGLDKLMGVAVAWPAPVQDPQSGDVVIDNSMRPWLGIRRPADKLKAMLNLGPGVEFWTENDANLAATMELEHGVGHRHENFLYVHWSSGIGGALVSKGVQVGGSHFAGELGHVPIPDADPAPERCRRCDSDRCLEVLAGGAAIVRRLTGSTETNLLDVIAMAHGEDSRAIEARRVLSEAARLVGQALGPIVTFNNPTAIVIGGAFGRHAGTSPQPADHQVQQVAAPNPFDHIEAALLSSLQTYASPRALDSVQEINSSYWRYGAVQGAVAFATRKALDSYVNDRAGNDSFASEAG